MKRTTVQADSPDRLNVIVEGSKVMGDMITVSNLRIDGEVIGNVSSAAKIVIGITGRIKGNLTCGDADIEGKVEGILVIDSLLSLRANSNIEGEITTGKLQVEEGAKFSGTCKMSNGSRAQTNVLKEKLAEDVVY